MLPFMLLYANAYYSLLVYFFDFARCFVWVNVHCQFMFIITIDRPFLMTFYYVAIYWIANINIISVTEIHRHQNAIP